MRFRTILGLLIVGLSATGCFPDYEVVDRTHEPIRADEVQAPTPVRAAPAPQASQVITSPPIPRAPELASGTIERVPAPPQRVMSVAPPPSSPPSPVIDFQEYSKSPDVAPPARTSEIQSATETVYMPDRQGNLIGADGRRYKEFTVTTTYPDDPDAFNPGRYSVTRSYSGSFRGAGSGPYYGGGHHAGSHGGTYIGGSGSSHRGGHYSNASTGNHYGHHK